jgi:hypothetical protein
MKHKNSENEFGDATDSYDEDDDDDYSGSESDIIEIRIASNLDHS